MSKEQLINEKWEVVKANKKSLVLILENPREVTRETFVNLSKICVELMNEEIKNYTPTIFNINIEEYVKNISEYIKNNFNFYDNYKDKNGKDQMEEIEKMREIYKSIMYGFKSEIVRLSKFFDISDSATNAKKSMAIYYCCLFIYEEILMKEKELEFLENLYGE